MLLSLALYQSRLVSGWLGIVAILMLFVFPKIIKDIYLEIQPRTPLNFISMIKIKNIKAFFGVDKYPTRIVFLAQGENNYVWEK